MWCVAIGRLTVRGAAQRRRGMRRRWGDRHGVQVACADCMALPWNHDRQMANARNRRSGKYRFQIPVGYQTGLE